MAESPQGRRVRVGRAQIVGFSLALVILILDQATKIWTLVGPLGEGARIDVFGDLFWLQYIRNYGISYGAFDGGGEVGRWVLTAIALAACAALTLWILKTKSRLVIVGAGLILGGAAGNVIDRIRLGYVVDFLAVDAVPILLDYIFNIADVGVTFGAACILADAVLGDKRKPGAAEA